MLTLSLHAADVVWPDLPDPVGLGPRLVTIEWLRERGVRVAAGISDDELLQAYRQHLAGPANRLNDGTTNWDAAIEADAARRLRVALKDTYGIDAPADVTLAAAEALWKQAKDKQTAADTAAIERLKAIDRRRSSPTAATAGVRTGLPEAAVERLMDPRYTGRQRGANWCWAACISMVCHYHGVTYSQEDIVRDTKGALRDEAGNVTEMLTALSASAIQPNGQPLQLVPQIVRGLEDIVTDLDKQQPIIVLLIPPGQQVGHAVVLTAIELGADGTCSFTVRDPAPSAPSRRVIQQAEFLRLYRAGLRLRVVRF